MKINAIHLVIPAIICSCSSVSINSRLGESGSHFTTYSQVELQKENRVFGESDTSIKVEDFSVKYNLNIQPEFHMYKDLYWGIAFSPGWIISIWEVGNFSPYIRYRSNWGNTNNIQYYVGVGTGFKPFTGILLEHKYGKGKFYGIGLEYYEGHNLTSYALLLTSDSTGLQPERNDPVEPRGQHGTDQLFKEFRFPIVWQLSRWEIVISPIIKYEHTTEMACCDEVDNDGYIDLNSSTFNRYVELKVSYTIDDNLGRARDVGKMKKEL